MFFNLSLITIWPHGSLCPTWLHIGLQGNFYFSQVSMTKSWLLKHRKDESVKFRAKTCANSVNAKQCRHSSVNGQKKHGFRKIKTKTSFVEALAANCTGRQIDCTPTHKYADIATHTRLYGRQLDVTKCNLLISRPLLEREEVWWRESVGFPQM